MARTPLAARTVNATNPDNQSKQPRSSLLVQKLAQRREAGGSPIKSKGSAIVSHRSLPAYRTTASVEDLPATRSPQRRARDDNSSRMTAQERPQEDSVMDVSHSADSSSSSSSVRRSNRAVRPAAGKGISPALAPLVQNSPPRQLEQRQNSTWEKASKARRPARANSATAETAPKPAATTGRRTNKRKSPSRNETQLQNGKQPTDRRVTPDRQLSSDARNGTRRQRTSLSQPLLSPPRSSKNSLHPTSPVRERASSTQPYSTPQQHRHRIFDVTKRRVAVTTVTKRGVWRAGSIVSTGPDEHFNHTPIVLRPRSPTDDPILLRPTPQEMEADRQRRLKQLQKLADIDADKRGDDTFAEVRGANVSTGDISFSSWSLNGSHEGPGSRSLSESFAESGIDDIPEEEEEVNVVEEQRDSTPDWAADGDGVDFGLGQFGDEAGQDAFNGFDASGGVSDESDDEGNDHSTAQDEMAVVAEAENDEQLKISEPSHPRMAQNEDSFHGVNVHNEGTDGQDMSSQSLLPSGDGDAGETLPSHIEEQRNETSSASPHTYPPSQDAELVLADKAGEPSIVQDLSTGVGLLVDTHGSDNASAELPRSSSARLPSLTPELIDPLADSASFLLEEQLRSHSQHLDRDGSEMTHVLRNIREEIFGQDTQHNKGASEDEMHSRDTSPQFAHVEPSQLAEQVEEQQFEHAPDADEDVGQEHGKGDELFREEVYDEHRNVASPSKAMAYRQSASISPIVRLAQSAAQTVYSPDERSYSRDTRADSLLERLYSRSGQSISPFVGRKAARAALSQKPSPFKSEPEDDDPSLYQLGPENASDSPRQQSSQGSRQSPSRSYSTLGANSTRLAMHSLARSTSIVEVLSTDAQAAARAAALLRVHHDWVHEGNLVSTEDGEDIAAGPGSPFRGNVLGDMSQTRHAEENVLPDLLEAAEVRLRSHRQTRPVQASRTSIATPARGLGTPSSFSGAPTPRAPGAYTFSPAATVRPQVDTIATQDSRVDQAGPSHIPAQPSEMKRLPDLQRELENDPHVFSRTAWKALDRTFRHVVREQARGGRAYVKPGVMEKRSVVLSLDRDLVVQDFIDTYQLDESSLESRWSYTSLLRSVCALQRKFFQRLEREYPGCLTAEEAAMTEESSHGSETSSAYRAMSVPHSAQDDGESLASGIASPFGHAELDSPRRPQASTPLVSKEKRMRRLDVYIPSPVRGDADDVARSPSPAPEPVEEQDLDTSQSDSVEQLAHDEDITAVQPQTPTAGRSRGSSVLFDVGSALKKRLSQVFHLGGVSAAVKETEKSHEAGQPRESATASPPSASPIAEPETHSGRLSNATTGLDEFESESNTDHVGAMHPAHSAARSLGEEGDAEEAHTGTLYPALPVSTNSRTQDLLPYKPRSSLAREGTDAEARLLARKRMQQFRDESIHMKRRMSLAAPATEPATSIAPQSPAIVLPLKRPSPDEVTAEPRKNSRPRKSLLVAKLSERRSMANMTFSADDTTAQSHSQHPVHPRVRDLTKRSSSPRKSGITHVSPFGRRREEELAYQRLQRQHLREESMRGSNGNEEGEDEDEEGPDESVLAGRGGASARGGVLLASAI